ncbi:ATP-binding protein [Neisseria sp. CCUG12390]|uniref:ATP-binding protein n=1 Tax=Neisseria sp. CCUG12390 TaxID=3392035 RepID=UPI003A0FE3D8
MKSLLHTLTHSLQIRLSLGLTALLLLLALMAGGFAFYDTYDEVESMQDELLEQTAAYINPTAPVTPPESENDAEIKVQLPNAANPIVAVSPQLSDGLYTLPALDDDDNDEYRVFVRTTPQGKIAVMQEIEYRNNLAEQSAWNSIVPILTALPVILALCVWLVYQAMRPIHAASQDLARRAANDLSPLNDEHFPSEIRGFVHAINHLLGRTDENIRQQQRFIADAAHELRSPMTALSLQAERLNNMDLPTEARSQSQQIQKSISRNRHLLEQLLSLARAQSADTPRRKTALSVQNLFCRVVQELLPNAAAKNQDLGVATENDCTFYADDTEIYTLLKIFADNAILYTPEGGRIDLGFDETESHLTLWVEDDGEGIPAAERSRVLDPFYRILGTEQQGTGLGLSIADTIAKRYGGRLELTDSTQFAHGLLIRAVLDKRFLQA